MRVRQGASTNLLETVKRIMFGAPFRARQSSRPKLVIKGDSLGFGGSGDYNQSSFEYQTGSHFEIEFRPYAFSTLTTTIIYHFT